MKYLKSAILFISIFLYHCTNSSEVSYGLRQFPNNLDPSFGLYFDESQISSQIYEKLISLDSDCETLLPQLAVKWDISEDKCIYEFVLRENVYFHDGAQLSSHSIVKTFEWLKNKKDRSEIYDKIKAIYLIDSLTFQFILYEPFSIFLYVLASPESFQVMSEVALNKYGEDIGRHPTGTGPFFLSKWRDSTEIVLKRFENYWDGPGETNKIVFKYYSDFFEREAELARLNIDILYTPTSYSVDRLKWTGYIDYHTFVLTSISFVGFNNQAYPFNNKQLRKAIHKAINVPRLVYNATRGNALVAKGPLPPNYYKYDDSVKVEYNIIEAKNILNKYGLNKIKVVFDYPRIAFSRATTISYLESELEKIGIQLDVRAHDSWTKWGEAVFGDSAQIFYDNGRSDIIGDPLNLLYGFFYSTSEFNSMKYNEPMIDQWIDEAFLEHDSQKRKKLYEKIVNKILDDTPAIFLSHVIPNFAYNTNTIKKLVADPYGIIQFNRIEIN